MMQFGKTIGTACSSFAVTNIDDLFVLVTFFTEASIRKEAGMTPLKITLGQYIGFTVIIVISMIGFGVSFVLPAEPIGFLGLLPILLGVWKVFGLAFDKEDEGEETQQQQVTLAGSVKSILKVSLITLMNGGDNVGTYIPLFSQTKGAEIAVYVVVYYILVGVWCLAAFLVLRQRHVLHVAQKYARLVIPFLYMGLGTYIVVKSDAYPWSVERIDERTSGETGQIVLAVVTTVLLLGCMGVMLWCKLRKRRARVATDDGIFLEANPSSVEEDVPASIPNDAGAQHSADITTPTIPTDQAHTPD